MGIMGFIWTVIVGLIVGILARWLYPGPVPMAWWLTALIGIAGSFVGGTFANLLNIEFYGWLGNLIVASVGAILVLWVWRRLRDRQPAS